MSGSVSGGANQELVVLRQNYDLKIDYTKLWADMGVSGQGQDQSAMVIDMKVNQSSAASPAQKLVEHTFLYGFDDDFKNDDEVVWQRHRHDLGWR